MRIGSIVAAAVLTLAVGSCKSEKAAARKLRKMDVDAAVDDRGRLKLSFRLFDAKHVQMPVTASYTGEVAKLDGAVICKAAGDLAPSDFTDKGIHKAQWVDAGCPADPGADELKVNVKLTVKGGAAEKEGKDAKDAKDAKGKDTVMERSITLAVKTLYERPPSKKPAAGTGSAATGSAAGSAATGSAATGSAATGSAAAGSAGAATGSAAAPAEKPAEKPASPTKKWPTTPPASR